MLENGNCKVGKDEREVEIRVVAFCAEMLNVVTKLYIFKYSSIIKGKNVNIS
jgi:hypothetical protein